MVRFLDPLYIPRFLDFFNTNDLSRKVMLGDRLLSKLAIVFIFSLCIYYFREEKVCKVSSLMAMITSVVLMIVIKIEMP